MENAEYLTAEANALTFKNAMRSTVASVNVITCEHDGNHYGLTATAFCSVSAEPPTVLICVHDKASASKHIKTSGHFCVNVLAHDMGNLASAFSGGKPREQRFESGEWIDLPSGNRALVNGAAFFDCQVSAVHKVGSHWLILGAVVDCKRQETPALVYTAGSFGSFKAN